MAYCLNPNCPTPQNPSAASFCQACGTPLTLAEKPAKPTAGQLSAAHASTGSHSDQSHTASADPSSTNSSVRYQLISPLGQGGFGRTFLAERLPTDQNRATLPCIIKQIYNNSLAGEANFQTETERLKKLGEHPQIPALLTAAENEFGQFLVQSFVPGNHLEAQIDADGPWNETQVRSLLKALVPVIQYVHSFDIIHRDIKPANIILSSDKNLLPTLVDFGAAKWVRQNPAKTVIGSAGYAAPEQSLGQATFASDIYSLGLSCLHALTGIHPFALYSAAEDRWVWRDYLPNPIEPRFAQLLDQMVAPSLQQRYESMDQVALDFQFSRNLLRHAPKQLLTRAKRTMAPLTGNLQTKNRALPTRPVIATKAQTWQRQQRLTQPMGLTQAISISPVQQTSGTVFATAGTDGAVRLWHLPSGQLIHTFPRRRIIGEGHTAGITALKFHPDGRALYSASTDGTIKEWDTAERHLLNTLPSAGWNPTALDITPDGAQLVSAYNDGQMVIWDITTLESIAQLTQHQKGVNAIAIARSPTHQFGPNDKLLVSTSADGTLKLWRWRPEKGPKLSKTISVGKQANQHRNRQKMFGKQGWKTPQGKSWQGGTGAIALAIHTSHSSSANGSTNNVSTNRDTDQYASPTHKLITVMGTGLVQSYSLDEQMNPDEPVTFYQSPTPITAFALSNNGTLAIGSEDTTLTLWDIDTGECVAKLAHDWGLVAVTFSADSQTLITASADEVISIWRRET